MQMIRIQSTWENSISNNPWNKKTGWYDTLYEHNKIKCLLCPLLNEKPMIFQNWFSALKLGSIRICTCAFQSLPVQLFTSLSFKLIMACNQDYWNGKTATNSPLSMQLEYVFEKFEEYLSCSKENLTSIFITSMTTKQ